MELGSNSLKLISAIKIYSDSDSVSKCPPCWTENDEGVCEFDTSATDCFTQTCNNGAMQLSINSKNLFNSQASDLGEYNQEVGVDNKNWPSSGV